MDKRGFNIREAMLCAAVVAVGCGSSEKVADQAPSVSEAGGGTVLLKFGGEAEGSSPFSIRLPLWWPAVDKLESEGSDLVYHGASLSLSGGRSFVVSALAKGNGRWSEFKQVYDDELRSGKKEKVVEGNTTYLLSGVSADLGALQLSFASGTRYDKSTGDLLFLNFDSKQREDFTAKHREDLLNSLRSARVGP